TSSGTSTESVRSLATNTVLHRSIANGAAALATAVARCATVPQPAARSAERRRTAHGVAPSSAPADQPLACGGAYAAAQDNVCQTADQLVTIRGERSRWCGADGEALLGLRVLPNEQIDVFVRSHMDDAGLARAFAATSPEAQAVSTGYVDGYNRFLRD